MICVYPSLKERQRAIRHGFPEALGLRAHRAISWLGRAEQEKDDPDARFIFLWISFNAAYAQDFPNRDAPTEKNLFSQFLQKLIELDDQNKLYELLWQKYSSSVRTLLDNKYVYQPFWDHQAGITAAKNWEERFGNSKAAAHRAIASRDALKVLTVVLDRLYVLRNQLIHGGATWNSAQNRAQVNDGANLLHDLVPIVIDLMMSHPETLWGEAKYPVVT